MKIKSQCAQLPPNVPTDWAYPVALGQAMAARYNIGPEIGQSIGYRETLCQVTDKRPGELHLVSWGWVKEAECTTECEV